MRSMSTNLLPETRRNRFVIPAHPSLYSTPSLYSLSFSSVVILNSLLLPAQISFAQEFFNSTVAPTTTASPLTIAPVIDGEVIADEAWSQVPTTTGFWQVRPDEGLPATQPTEVWVGFTEDALYIGVMAYDDCRNELRR